MGNSASKAAKTAAGASTRKYPTRVPNNIASSASKTPPAPTPASTTAQGPTVHPKPQASFTRDDGKYIEL
jgi:hypothetical protein